MAGAILLFVVLLSGCATQTQALLHDTPSTLPPRTELAATPFFAQTRYQCGPAALAMALNAAGIAVTPDRLTSQVYLPQREGSLQPEMLAAARRNGAFSMTIAPTLDALLTEVAAGHPVIVLQNLSLPLIPLWHYAVVIGYDINRAEIVLRSGLTERELLPLSTFEHTWARSGYWGMVALQPGQLPATAGKKAAVDAAVAFERVADATHANKVYQAALQRWPDDLTLQLGDGNTAYAAGDRSAAVAAFRRAVRQHPDSAPALNNLATALADLGQFDQARAVAEQAYVLGGPWHDAVKVTLQSIETARRKGSR